ncbi:MAG: ImmA/IrrE family metallo-endopeptidase [Phycisphaerae bacterium]|nr:ImmA/IrrE family metallo-endopeptidase [Phycisphaerae bacterium]
MTLSQVKERTDIGESSISEFENGKREPSLSQLQVLANTYRRSVAFFLTEGAITPEIVLWREKPAIGCEEVESVFIRLCEQYHNLELWTEEELPVYLPMVPRSTGSWNYMKSETLAKQVRDDLNLGDRPGLSLLSVLEEVCGVKIFHLNFEPSGTAASTLSDSFGAAMLLNEDNVRWRRNFDLAHELFHLLTWHLFRKGNDEASSFAAGEIEERFANAFASHLLLPDEAVRSAFGNKLRDGKLGYLEIYDIARQFDVSAEAILWRLFNLKLFADHIKKEQVQEFAQNLKAMSTVFEERYDTKAPKRPERYQMLAIKALRSGAMSIGRFAEYMEVPRHKVMKYIQQEVTDDQEVPLAPA